MSQQRPRGDAASGMRRGLPPGYRRDWSEHFAQPPTHETATDTTALVFRIGPEWLALPAHLCVMAAEPVVPRRLPHRADRVLLGLVGLRGQLYPCISLAHLLHLDEREPPPRPGPRPYARLLVLQFEGFSVAVPIAELTGLQRYAQSALEAPPAAAAQSVPRYLLGVLSAGERRIGCLDAELLAKQIARRIK